MTARHAIAVPHPLLRNLYELAGDAWMAVWHPVLHVAAWLVRHFFGVVVTEVAAAFVTALGMAFMVSGLPVVSVVVFTVAIAVTARVAYKMGRTS